MLDTAHFIRDPGAMIGSSGELGLIRSPLVNTRNHNGPWCRTLELPPSMSLTSCTHEEAEWSQVAWLPSGPFPEELGAGSLLSTWTRIQAIRVSSQRLRLLPRLGSASSTYNGNHGLGFESAGLDLRLLCVFVHLATQTGRLGEKTDAGAAHLQALRVIYPGIIEVCIGACALEHRRCGSHCKSRAGVHSPRKCRQA